MEDDVVAFRKADYLQANGTPQVYISIDIMPDLPPSFMERCYLSLFLTRLTLLLLPMKSVKL